MNDDHFLLNSRYQKVTDDQEMDMETLWKVLREKKRIEDKCCDEWYAEAILEDWQETHPA